MVAFSSWTFVPAHANSPTTVYACLVVCDVSYFTASPVTVTVPASDDISATAANGATGAVVHFNPPTATSTVDGPLAAVACTSDADNGARLNGDTFPTGTTVVTCAAVDSRHYPGVATFSVVVTAGIPNLSWHDCLSSACVCMPSRLLEVQMIVH